MVQMNVRGISMISSSLESARWISINSALNSSQVEERIKEGRIKNLLKRLKMFYLRAIQLITNKCFVSDGKSHDLPTQTKTSARKIIIEKCHLFQWLPYLSACEGWTKNTVWNFVLRYCSQPADAACLGREISRKVTHNFLKTRFRRVLQKQGKHVGASRIIKHFILYTVAKPMS